MNSLKKLMLPILVAGSVGMTMPAVMAEPTVIPFRLAQVDYDSKPGIGDTDLNNNGVNDMSNDGKTVTGNVDRDRNPGMGDSDLNNNGRTDRPGMSSLDDNVSGPADTDDAEPQTYDATFWVLMALLAIGIIAMVIAATRRRTTVS